MHRKKAKEYRRKVDRIESSEEEDAESDGLMSEEELDLEKFMDEADETVDTGPSASKSPKGLDLQKSQKTMKTKIICRKRTVLNKNTVRILTIMCRNLLYMHLLQMKPEIIKQMTTSLMMVMQDHRITVLTVQHPRILIVVLVQTVHGQRICRKEGDSQALNQQ